VTDRQALSKAKSIDIHAHAVLAGSMGTAGIHGPEIGYTEAGDPWFRVGDYRLDGVRYEGSPFMESAVRLANMDAADLDCQVLSPNPRARGHCRRAFDSASGICSTADAGYSSGLRGA
jgi:aminocarboxymuconate-semialdehyde decarboxylase